MRLRVIKPEVWDHPGLSSVSPYARLVFMGLWSYVQDEGVGLDSVGKIAGTLFTTDMERDYSGTVDRISAALDELADAALIIRFRADGFNLLEVADWSAWQKPKYPSKQKYPRSKEVSADPPETLRKTSGDSPETLPPGDRSSECGDRSSETGERRSGFGVQGEGFATPTNASSPAPLDAPAQARGAEEESAESADHSPEQGDHHVDGHEIQCSPPDRLPGEGSEPASGGNGHHPSGPVVHAACEDCEQPVVPGKAVCAEHLESRQRAVQASRTRTRALR